MSCPPDKVVFDTERGEYICTETGEVLEERIAVNDFYHNINFSEVMQGRHKEKREKRSLDISIDKLISIILSKLDEKEKDLFQNLIDRIQKKDAAMIIAIYEYVLLKFGKMMDNSLRESLGISDYSVRRRKKILRQLLKDHDQALNEIEKDDIAREVYEYLVRKNIITGYKAKKRIEILRKYLKDENFMKRFRERKYALEILKSESIYSKRKRTERKYALMLV